MKKYWKLISISTIIVLSIGTFYVNVALSAEQHPAFEIKTVSGDAAEIKPVVLNGFYEYKDNEGLSLNITAEGSTYTSYTFVDQLIGQSNVMITELQEKYRGFMRGKIGNINLYSEDDAYLAFGDVSYKRDSLHSSDFKFNVSVLNKKGGDTNAFTLDVPNGENLDNMYVYSVQLNDKELTLITQNVFRNNNDYYDEKYIYTIDLENKTISNHEKLSQFAEVKGGINTNVEVIETNLTTANEYIILLQTEETEETEETITSEGDKNQKVNFYNLVTKEKGTIDVPELEGNQLSYFDGSTLYFTKVEGQELVVTPYSLADEQVGQAINLPLSLDNVGNVQDPLIKVNNGKVYAVVESEINKDFDANVIVADLDTGETRFEGQIALKDTSKKMGNNELYFYEIILR